MIKSKIKKLFTNEPIVRLILLSEADIDMSDRISYAWSVFKTAAPVVFFMNMFHIWVAENKAFADLMIAILAANMAVGFVFHIVNKTFSPLQFIAKNALMLVAVFISYYCMDAIRVVMGDNIIGNIYRSTMQVITLAYPISKIFKNIFILTNGNFPPKIVMIKLYNVMKNGDLKTFFDKNSAEVDPEIVEEVNNIIKNNKIKQN